MLFIYSIHTYIFFPSGSKKILLTVHTKEKNFLTNALVSWEASSQKSVMSLFWGKNGHSLGKKISSLHKILQEGFYKRGSLERDINPHASGFYAAPKYQRFKQLLRATSSIINYCGVSYTVLAGYIRETEFMNNLALQSALTILILQ